MTGESEAGKQGSSKGSAVSRQDLEGSVFGQLTVLSVHKDSKNNTKCLCRCSCGREKDVYLSNLVSGATKSCGCLAAKKLWQKKDLTGRRFGNLTAIEPTEERQYGSVVWRCRCDCGREAFISQKDLENKRKTSCGCKSKPRGRAASNLLGKRFGKLTVVSQTNERTKKGSVIWECRCDCGNTVRASSDNLIYGNQRSCGCMKVDTVKEARQNLHFVDGTCIEWLEGRKDRVDNTSGRKGVSRRKNGRYLAKIGFQNRQYYLGTYDNMEEAVAARQQAESILFENFLNEYRNWQESGEEESFHFDAEAVKTSLSALKSPER